MNAVLCLTLNKILWLRCFLEAVRINFKIYVFCLARNPPKAPKGLHIISFSWSCSQKMTVELVWAFFCPSSSRWDASLLLQFENTFTQSSHSTWMLVKIFIHLCEHILSLLSQSHNILILYSKSRSKRWHKIGCSVWEISRLVSFFYFI